MEVEFVFVIVDYMIGVLIFATIVGNVFNTYNEHIYILIILCIYI